MLTVPSAYSDKNYTTPTVYLIEYRYQDFTVKRFIGITKSKPLLGHQNTYGNSSQLVISPVHKTVF